MDEEIRYPVCPHRNVPAAFQRFLGPDSGGIERFFPHERSLRVDDTILIVRMKGRRVVEGFSQDLQRVVLIVSDAAVLVRAVLVVGGVIAASSARERSRWMQERFALLFRWRNARGLPV